VVSAEFQVARSASEWIEIAAIVIIVIGVIVAVGRALVVLVTDNGFRAFKTFKRLIAWGLLIGLDLLIAADVIKTVTLDPTLENALVLAILVVIRTFLSWALVLEAEGRWPWQAETAAMTEREDEGVNVNGA
jgi:uncharacterized membrane protein